MISNSNQEAENILEVKEAFEASKCVQGVPVMHLLQQDPSPKSSETVTSHQLEIKYLNSRVHGGRSHSSHHGDLGHGESCLSLPYWSLESVHLLVSHPQPGDKVILPSQTSLTTLTQELTCVSCSLCVWGSRKEVTCAHSQNSALCLESTLKGSLASTSDWASGQKCRVYLEFPSALLAKNRLPVSASFKAIQCIILTVYSILVSNMLFIC